MRDIKGYEGLYAVTTCGRIWSYKKKGFLAQTDNGDGYYLVRLSKNGYSKNFLVHRLVAQTYVENPFNLPCVSHLDEERTHNWASNLKWCTHKENNDMPKYKQRQREGHKRRLAESKRADILVNLNTGEGYFSIRDASEKTGIYRQKFTDALRQQGDTFFIYDDMWVRYKASEYKDDECISYDCDWDYPDEWYEQQEEMYAMI